MSGHDTVSGSGGSATLRPLFAPRGIAVVGASRRGVKLGAMMAGSLAGYAGGPVLVNTRNPDRAAGVYASVGEAVASTGEPVDLAVLCVPAAACAAALTEAAEAGVRAALVCAGGFGEAGEEGARLQRDLARVVAATGVRLLGPNTSGFFVPAAGLTASFVPGAARVPSGGIAVVAASGGVNHALAFELANAGNGISLAAGIGAGLDVTAADVLDYLAEDPLTTAVALHVETVPDGPRLVAAVRRLSAVKPVVALVVGRSDVGDFARSHTGALATSWRVTRAALRQAGAVLAEEEGEAVDALTALSRLRLAPAADPGLGIVTAQAGPGLLLVDRVKDDGIRVPDLTGATRERIGDLLPPLTYQRNPVDTGRPAETFPGVLRAVADDPGVDLLAVYALTEPGSVDLADAVGAARVSAAVVAVGGLAAEAHEIRARLHEAGVPAFGTAAAAANAVRALVADARARHIATHPATGHVVTDLAATGRTMTGFSATGRTMTGSTATGSTATGRAVPGSAVSESAAAGSGVSESAAAGSGGPFPVTVGGVGAMDEAEAKDLLDRLGVRTPERRVCADHAEAHRALRELTGPVAVKLLDAEVTHKTEVGGVRLGVRDPAELDEALAALDAAGARRYLVERMVSGGPELVVGARRDPVFGPVVLLGLGGTAAEALSDVAVRLAPLSAAEAARMPDDLAGRRLLEGWRGGPVLDEHRLGGLLAALGGLLAASPSLEEIEINPLRLTERGLVALDAVVVRARTETGGTRDVEDTE
ncbi:acetate--CoA ligase family protein [Streptosporangium carneum]|uniref:ATP-grasp domain-containing protein n=1 Tax=Streptosporangium carneum TaxID=47481 RepID=A0A9W6HYD5_9ACTN|nr:acetate--CoA ligase family protein [Streptosporangium carneum]GLK08362.1 hypothetical protein GCM10017600_17670 [Streptosporangium carneum]